MATEAELRNNMKKYLDIAKNEKVVIQRGRNETFVLVAQNNIEHIPFSSCLHTLHIILILTILEPICISVGQVRGYLACRNADIISNLGRN